MKFYKYNVNLDGIDKDELISEWKWAIPAGLSVAAITRFGDCFLVSEDHRIIFLDILDGALVNCGEGDLFSDEFVELNRERFSVDWTDICRARGMSLEAGQCYGWKVHPIVGGKFSIENIGLFTLRVYESITGQLVRQVTQSPQGYRLSGFKLDAENE